MGLRDRIESERAQSAQLALEETEPYRRRLLEQVDLNELAALSDSQRRVRLERIVGQMVTRDGPVMANSQRTALIRRVIDEAVGLGVLEPLLSDQSVTEIMVNGPDSVWVERAGRLEPTGVRFSSEAQLMQTIDRIVSQVNRRVDESSPMVDARLPTGERVNVIIPPLSLVGPVLTIRRFPRQFTLSQLVTSGALDEPTRELLAAFVRSRLNVVISGGTGAGKTTLLNALSSAIAERERIVTIEESAELVLQQPHVISLESRPANVEQRGEITIRDLVRNSLRMRPDRIIVGEVRGVETLDMLQALNTGHEGSLVTVHANTAEDALYRIETLASISDLKIPHDAMRTYINNAIHAVAQVERSADGQRRVVEVAVVMSRRNEPFALHPVMRFEAEPIGPDRRVKGTPRLFGLPEQIVRHLALQGIEPPAAFRRSVAEIKEAA